MRFRDDTTEFQVHRLPFAYLRHNQQPKEASGKDPQSHITKIWHSQVKAKKDTDFYAVDKKQNFRNRLLNHCVLQINIERGNRAAENHNQQRTNKLNNILSVSAVLQHLIECNIFHNNPV